jgi:cellulose synthase/poly-beta-1,6-N-acetylglucosamine synthase-like glycosyltransferase
MRGPSSCCLAASVLTIFGVAAVVAYATVWDDTKTFETWVDRFFSSEKKLADDTRNGNTELELVGYDAGRWVYFIVLCILFVINLLVFIPSLTVVLRRRCKSVSVKVEAARNLEDKPSVDVIIPCYMPNEKDIIEETLWHVLQKVESPGDMKVWLVYNTPKDMPEIEARLAALSQRLDLPHGRKLSVMRVTESKSKAENINFVMPQLTAKYTVIYDADHHPDPESLLLLVEKLRRKDLACAQGSTYIRDLNSGLLARIIDAEFFVTHFVYFPCMRFLTRNAVFCGSNGLWQTEILKTTSFSPKMQTEDIDVSVRMLLEKHRIDFCPESRSGELAPVSLRALFKQRMRWAIGWDEVSLQLWRKMMSAEVPRSRKFGVAYVCYSRWWMQIVGFVAGIVTPALSFVQRANPELCHCGMGTQLIQTCLFYFSLVLVVGCFVEAMFQVHHRGAQSLIQALFVALFMGAGVLYIAFQGCLIVVSLFKIGTGTVGGWTVTARRDQKPKVQTEPKIMNEVDEETPKMAKVVCQESPIENDLVVNDSKAQDTTVSYQETAPGTTTI